ncbi:MAG: hypothetical protein NC935_05460, partial [Candidatus Omnitrophica bacterium]|nr:hypothetical protein [Candidatus Omnitrophota bacterium]
AKEGFKKILSDRLGELTFYIILAKYLDDTLAKTIAAGWGNDYCYLYESKEQKAILIMDTIWDSTSDAEEFFKGIKALCDKKYSQLNWQTNKDFFIGENANNLIYISRKSNSVAVIESEIKDYNIIKKILETLSLYYKDNQN